MKLKEDPFRLDIRKGFFFFLFINIESDETLEQSAWRGSGCLLMGNIQGQIGWASESTDGVQDNPFNCEGEVRLDGL